MFMKANGNEYYISSIAAMVPAAYLRKILRISGYRERAILEDCIHVQIYKEGHYDIIEFHTDERYFEYCITTDKITG